jgi:hypothetical protein
LVYEEDIPLYNTISKEPQRFNEIALTNATSSDEDCHRFEADRDVPEALKARDADLFDHSLLTGF